MNKTLFIESDTHIKVKDNNLHMESGEKNLTIFHDEISTVVLNNKNTTLTVKTLNYFIENNITVLHINDKGMPFGITTSYNNSYNELWLLKEQINNQKLNKKLWKHITKNNILNKLLVMEYVTNDSILLRKMKKYYDNVKYGDSTIREAPATKLFFNTLYGDDYTRFDDDQINYAQNYGYKIIVAKIQTILVSKGFSSVIGMNHQSNTNHYNLAYDIIEPFRAFIDYYVWFNFNSIKDGFTTEHKKEMISLLNVECKIGNKIYSLETAISQTIISIMDCYRKNDDELYKDIIFMDMYEV